MKSNEERDKIQNKLKKIHENNKDILLEFATGIGKTKQALDLASGKVLIVHYEISHAQNILNEINKHGFKKDNYSFSTYRSFHKVDLSNFKYIIFDEAHHISLTVMNHIKKYKGNILYLSATMIEKKWKMILNHNPETYRYTITISEAVKIGLLPVPKIKVHWVELGNEANYYICERNPIKQTVTIPFEKWDTHNKWSKKTTVICNSKQHYEILNKEYNEAVTKYLSIKDDYYLNRTTLEEFKKYKFFKDMAGKKRKDFINRYKFRYTKELFKSLKGKKILFTDSIESCEKFPYSVNSKNNTKINAKIIEEFKNGDINNLAVVGMMKESHNIPNLSHVINQQVDFSNFLSFIQIQGRALRSNKTVYHCVFVKNTIDEEIFNNLKNENLL